MGRVFSIKGKMRLPFANGMRGCAKLAHFVATDKRRKGSRVAKKHCENSGFGQIWLLYIYRLMTQTDGFNNRTCPRDVTGPKWFGN